MRELVVGLVLFGLVAAGCGGAGSSSSEPGQEPGSSEGDVVVAAEMPDDATDELRISKKGWKTDFSKHTVPLEEFWPVRPVKDGIPSLDRPAFVSVDEAGEWLEAREPVIELEINGVARAYPLQILIWHEIVNDELGGVPLVVTFCPLCYTALVFERTVDGERLDFGTTGNLRNSDLVMYDRQTESWWQQFGGEAVVGEFAGQTLVPRPAAIVAWEDFASRHPDAEVLSQETGFDRYYGINPYGGYDRIDDPPFFRPANQADDRLLPKERVVFFESGAESVAVPFSHLEQVGRIEFEVGGQDVEVLWLERVRSSLDHPFIKESKLTGAADVRSVATGERIPFDTPFWFAVAAFRPDTRVVTG